LVATVLDLPANSLSITARQPALRSERCLTMQAVIFEIFGISELQSLKASPVHICCASALKAKLAVEDTAEVARATARTKPAWRRLLANELVIFGSHLVPPWRPVVAMTTPCASPAEFTVTALTSCEPTVMLLTLPDIQRKFFAEAARVGEALRLSSH
jgi:hypothetical protein